MPSNPKPPPRIKLTPKKYKELCSQVWGRDRGICQICDRYTVVPDYHHVIFRSQGGSDSLDNMMIVCKDPCHNEIHHGNKHCAEYRQKAIDRMEEINGNT